MGLKKILSKNTINILILFLVSLLVMIPMFINLYHSGHDTIFHLCNVLNMTEQIKINFFNPSKIVGVIANNFGYGTFIFYPPLAHMLVSYLYYFIGDVFLSFKLIHLLSLFLSGVTMYYLANKLSKDNKIALISALLYMLNPYHLSDIYIRDAMAESYLFVFLPMIISSLYELFYGDKNKFYFLFIFGYVGGIYSHLTMMVYFTILIIIYLLFKYKDTLKNIKYFIIASIFILLIASPFLVPLIEHRFLGDYNVFKEGVMAQNIMWQGLFPYNYVLFVNYGTYKTKYFLDIVSLIMLVVTALNYKKLNLHKFYKFIFIFGIASFILSLKLFPWDLLPNSFRVLQFPYRFSTFVALSTSLLAPLCLKMIKKEKVKKIIAYVSIIILLIFTYPNLTFATKEIMDLDNLWLEGGMGYEKEYLPFKTANNMNYYQSRNSDILVIDGKAQVEIIKNEVPYLEFKISTNGSNIELPRLYYLGYTLKDQNDNKISLTEDQYGFLSAYIEKDGTYYLDYTGTNIDNISKYVSLMSLLIFICWRFYEKN